MQSSGSRQVVVRHSSGSRQAVVRQLSSSYQAVIRQSSVKHQAVVRQSSGSLQIVKNVLKFGESLNFASTFDVKHCTTRGILRSNVSNLVGLGTLGWEPGGGPFGLGLGVLVPLRPPPYNALKKEGNCARTTMLLSKNTNNARKSADFHL
jgi:hypothetical protein